MEFIAYMLVAAVGWFVISNGLQRLKRQGGDGRKHCMTCGSEGQPKTVTKGSIGIELLLWLFFIVPGLIYSIWRLSTRHDACSQCGGTALVPIDAPAAVAQRKAQEASAG